MIITLISTEIKMLVFCLFFNFPSRCWCLVWIILYEYYMMTHFRKRGFPRGSDATQSQNLNVQKFCPIVSIPEFNLERFQRKLGFGDGCWRSFVDDNMLLTSLRFCWPIRDFGGLFSLKKSPPISKNHGLNTEVSRH